MRDIRPARRLLLLLVIVGMMTCACAYKPNAPASTVTTPQHSNTNAFDDYLNTEFEPADGFDFAVGDKDAKGNYQDKATAKSYSGWYVATHFADNYSYGIHTGEDWTGNGPPASDLGQDVHAIANGKVAFAGFCGRLWGNVVMIDHIFYENNEKKQVRSVYAHLHDFKVNVGQIVRRREVIATVGQDPDKLFAPHLHLELRWDQSLSPTYWPSANGKDIAWMKDHYTAPTAFINSHRSVPRPQLESSLILINRPTYKMRFYQSGKMIEEFDVGLGQGRGAKEIEGDKKTPLGMYFVIQKHSGDFDGPYAPYFGGYWMRINYPNAVDASRGQAQNLISVQQQREIATKWANRQPTLERTALGGGIGFHGWNKEWDNRGTRDLSFGCIVLHLYDVAKFYERIPEGTMVVIF
jgi:murein DD-endopeptidase MepM/ murein hydrolase activator NlpD